METKIEFCKNLELDFLPAKIGDFSLNILQKQENKKYYIFEYTNEQGFSWTALYDNEVEDFTVYIKTGLQCFNEISFIKQKQDAYWENLKARFELAINKTLVNPEQSFVFAYRQKGIDTWDYNDFLPEEINGYKRTITPDKGIKGINGTYTIAEYKYPEVQTGIVICYNVYRDEFFAEMFQEGIAVVTHALDAKTFKELENALKNNLENELSRLEIN